MNKLRQILQFIRALLGFLLNLKKKEKDEKKEEVVMPDNQPEVARVLPGDTGDDGFVGGPYRNRPGLDRGPVDTLGVRKRFRGRFRKQLTVAAGYTLMLCAVGSCLVKMMR
ncbi:MAG TPA: hypothetical protein DCZ45_15255 [Parabacteroides goldsteinii]|jgi:hypothetical protein|uniref:hypothetical protein n=1 Tax=Parabacteroides goldsteinii TaxID=328812 RepID=UPI000E90CEAE|nr:hypothetical protein [Parabacteroides goldsteinii]HBA31916.1 hypothetical protein [Parabacteroides goldsteinii]